MITYQSQQEERYMRLTTAPLIPLLIKMAIPTMIGMMVSTVYSMSDTYFVGRLNRTDWTAAIGVVFSFLSIIQAVGFWFGYGSGNYIARQLGKQNKDEAEQMAVTGFVFSLVAGIIIMIFSFIFIKPLALLLGAGVTEEMLSASLSYLKIIIFSIPFMLGANVLYNQLRLQGNAKDGMIGLLIGMILNMILDPIFILIMNWNVAGAAMATCIGQIAGFVILLYLVGKHGNVPIRFFRSRIRFNYLFEILAGGAPNFCRQGISSCSNILLNQAAGLYGSGAVAAIAITSRILTMGYALVIGFGQGFQPICAMNYGAKNYKRVKKAFLYEWIIATAFLIVTSAVIYYVAEPITGLFTNKQEILEISESILRAQCLVWPFMGFYVLIGMLLQNIGRFLEATLVTISENGIFFIPAILILPRIWGLSGIIWAKPAAGIGALLFSAMLGIKTWKKYLTSRES
ncbi:putative MATE family efflux protein [Lachnotalea glycerini]|uniref:Multidrug export protein MepA n=1 Tax=Lachnotalea glycerini TaxID=1763509 RepID=A0A318EGJ7_9FIRM|nr:MATE family efflux transporter [Lachnotalea glycerini]PXV85063.1 putative MATE family efflux protein [Lachnotalea glycerini]